MLTLGSLFDGIGGWLLAAKHAGIEPIWASEIEPFPASVTAYHFPNVVQLGDITKLDGAKLWPVDIITAGSPCQDLSVAGKREGLSGERSGLFLRAIKLVRDMRRASRGRYPRFFVWENVPGAFSSNRGRDFHAVLQEIGEAEIPVPPDVRWAQSGLVELPKCDIAWRTLDAQHWGVPQRRKRIFLVADFATERRCAGEILFEWKSVSGNTAESGEAREGIAAGVESGVGNASVLRMRAGCEGGGKGPLVSMEKSLTLATGNDQVLFNGCLTPWDCQIKRIYGIDGKFPTLQAAADNGEKPGSVYIPDKARSLTARMDGSPCIDCGPNIVATFQNTGRGWWNESPIAETLRTPCGGDSTKANLVAVYDMTHADEVMRRVPDGRAPTLNARMGTGGNQVPVIVGNGQLAQVKLSDVARTLNCMHDQQAVMMGKSVRRLTPTECERLQGLPDGYTDVPCSGKPASDTARYKALGNGMAMPCADYVIRRIAEVAK